MSKPKGEKTQIATLRREVNALRRANHVLTVERQGYALRARVAECESKEWRERFDLLLKRGAEGK